MWWGLDVRQHAADLSALAFPPAHNATSLGYTFGDGDEFTARMQEAINGMMLDMIAAIARKGLRQPGRGRGKASPRPTARPTAPSGLPSCLARSARVSVSKTAIIDPPKFAQMIRWSVQKYKPASWQECLKNLDFVASLIETCKLSVEPLGYLADVLARIANSHTNSRIDELLPWAYIRAPELKAVA